MRLVDNLARVGDDDRAEPAPYDRDAALAQHKAETWHALRTNGRARNGDGTPIAGTSLASDLATRLLGAIDDATLKRLIVSAARAELRDDLHAMYLQVIAIDVLRAVRKVVEDEAMDRECRTCPELDWMRFEVQR